MRLLMLKLTSDLFPLSGKTGPDNGFHEGPRGPVTFQSSVRWLDGGLMGTCHLSSASIIRARRHVCPCLLVCHALRWSAFHYVHSGSDPCQSSLSRTRTPPHNSHISENRPVYGLPSDTLVCFGTKQSYMLSNQARRRTMFWKQSGVISVYVTRAWKTSEDPCFIWFNSRWWEHALCQRASDFKAFSILLVPNRSCWRRLTVCQD